MVRLGLQGSDARAKVARPRARVSLPLTVALLVGCSSGLAACALVLGIDDPIVDASAGDATTHPSGDASRDGARDGGTDHDAAPSSDASKDGQKKDTSSDAPAADETSCASTVIDTAKGYFVAPKGSDGPKCGPVATPCQTIQQGITAAHAAGKSVLYVAPGVYFESLKLEPGLVVQGGVELAGSKWSPVCNAQTADAVQVVAPPGTTTTVTAASLGGTTTLRAMTIESSDTSALAPGQSVYGILAEGHSTHLVLDQVVVSLAPAAMGGQGDSGAPGVAGTGVCSASDGVRGGPGDQGAGSDGGTFGEAGYVPGQGGTGGVGVMGHPGVDGGAGACQIGCAISCGITCPAEYSRVCAAPGESGCGGLGGSGGAPGSGGGSSIAVFSWGADVQITDSLLQPGAGGGGGAGGPGGVGGPGASGVRGPSGLCITSCPGTTTCSATASITLEGGDAGGAGGTGGVGGVGGGGAGGWSCGYYRGGGATVTVTQTTVVPAEAGAGGSPLGVQGVSKPGCP